MPRKEVILSTLALRAGYGGKPVLQGLEIEVKGELAVLVGGRLLPQAYYNSESRVVAGERYQPSLPRSFVFTVDARSHLRMRCLGCSVHQMQFAVDGNLIRHLSPHSRQVSVCRRRVNGLTPCSR